MSRERKWFRCLMPLCRVTGRSLGGILPWRASCDPPAGQHSCLMLPVGGERGIGQGWRAVCTQLHPLPYNCAQRGRGLKEPCENLLASLAGDVSSKLRTLAAASCAACQNLLWGLSQTNFVQQSGSLSTGVASLSSLGIPKYNQRVVAPAHTMSSHSEGSGCGSDAILIEYITKTILRQCGKAHTASWGDQRNWKKILISKGMMEKHFFTLLWDWM